MSHELPDDWTPLDLSVLHDQRGAYDKMREQCPVAHSKFMDWSLFRHEDIANVLADPVTFINTSRFPAIPNGLNPPEHGPYNSAVATFFSEDKMAGLEPLAREISTQLLAPLCVSGEAEFVSAYITPYVMRVQCALLGWPEQQWQDLANWVAANQQVALSGDPLVGKELAEVFTAQVTMNLDSRRNTPHTPMDATDGLLQIEVNGRRLRDDEITTILRNWVAGHGTTADALSIVVLHLAKQLQLQEQLRRSPDLIPAAIEEILRVDGPLIANRRTTTREVQIAGHTIPKDASLSLMWIAANRDPRVFEDADTVRIDRSTADGLVWGKGIHFCLGAPMARLEMHVALEQLLAQTTVFELTAAEPQRKVYPGNGIAALSLRFK